MDTHFRALEKDDEQVIKLMNSFKTRNATVAIGRPRIFDSEHGGFRDATEKVRSAHKEEVHYLLSYGISRLINILKHEQVIISTEIKKEKTKDYDDEKIEKELKEINRLLDAKTSDDLYSDLVSLIKREEHLDHEALKHAKNVLVHTNEAIKAIRSVSNDLSVFEEIGGADWHGVRKMDIAVFKAWRSFHDVILEQQKELDILLHDQRVAQDLDVKLEGFEDKWHTGIARHLSAQEYASRHVNM